MIKLKVKKRFHIRGSEFMKIGQEFSAAEESAREYVALGLATYANETDKPAPPPSDNRARPRGKKGEPDIQADPINLQELKVNELRNLAQARKVNGNISKMRKDQLIQALTNDI